VDRNLRGVGERSCELSWLISLSDGDDAASELLSRAYENFDAWPAACLQTYGAGLPKVPLLGIPDTWPHVVSALATGYKPAHTGQRGTLYGGPLPGVGPLKGPPAPGMTVRRTVGRLGVRFSAMLGWEELGRCECLTDLDRGGTLPARCGWSELSEVYVADGWRNGRVGS
jgi:hypothetical protein